LSEYSGIVSLAHHCSQLEEVDMSGMLQLTDQSLSVFCDLLANTTRTIELTVGGKPVLLTNPELLFSSSDLIRSIREALLKVML
jgi:hypothetical protein